MSTDQHGETTLILARYAAGLGTRAGHLEDAGVVVRGGRIAAVAAADELRPAYPEATVIERTGHLLCPGLVNAHAECALTLLRGAADDLPDSRWQRDVVGPARRRWEDASFVRDATALALCDLVRAGVTCINDASTFPDVVAREFERFGVRGRVAIPIEPEPNRWAATLAAAFSQGLAVRDQYRAHARIGFSFAPAQVGTLDDATLQRVRTLSNQLDEPVHTVVHRTRGEIQQCLSAHGQRPLARLQAHGLLSPALVAVHANHLEDDDIALLCDAGAQVVHCPQANLRFASGRAPVDALLARGVNVALGTAGAARSGRLDPFAEMRCAAMLAKDVSGSAGTLSAGQALHMATLGGARALGLGAQIGSLEVGKWADLICVDLSGAATQPVYDPVASLVWSAGREQVSDVWVAGRALLREGSLIAADERKIVDNAMAWARRIGTA